MAASPALKIVRHSKPPGDVKNGPRIAGGAPSAAKPTIAANGPLPFTMTDAEIGRELRLSAKSIRRMHDAAKLPRPVMVGARSLRWVRQTIVEWLAAGCPDRATFEANREGGGPGFDAATLTHGCGIVALSSVCLDGHRETMTTKQRHRLRLTNRRQANRNSSGPMIQNTLTNLKPKTKQPTR